LISLFLVIGLLAVQWQMLTLGCFMLLMIVLMIVHCVSQWVSFGPRHNRGFRTGRATPTRPDEE